MATYQVAIFNPSDITITDLGGGNYSVALAPGAVRTIVTVTDTNVGADETIFNDGNPAVDGGAGTADPLQTFSGTIDGTTYTGATINPEWAFDVDSGEGQVFRMNVGNNVSTIGYGFTFEPTPGTTYTLNTANGTFLPNIPEGDLFVCFTKGTMIETEDGERRIETLEVGDRIWTENGFQTLRWIGNRTVSTTGNATPIRIKAGVFDNHTDLLVSQQHRMVVSGYKVELLFGEPTMLVAAKMLTSLDGVNLDRTAPDVTYFHLLFDKHEILLANGALSESFYPGDNGLDVLDSPQYDEVMTIFPELKLGTHHIQMAYPKLRAFEAAALTSF